MTSTKKSQEMESVLKLDQYWPYLVTVLADRIARRTSALVKAEGLNLSQWRVLAALADVPGRSAMEVVNITPMDKGIVSRATKMLLHHGLIRKESSSVDGRMSHLHLTEAGHRLYQRLRPQVSALLQVSSLSSEENALLPKILHQLIDALPDSR